MTQPGSAILRPRRRVRLKPRAEERATPRASVSVVIPCFNYASFVGDATRSALEQRGVDVDVIIVDDASTDDSLGQAEALARSDARVRVITHGTNAGPVVTFNDGLAHASGEFVVRLDADDLLTPGSLSRSVALARAFPTVGLVYGHPIHFRGRDLPKPRTVARRWTVWPGGQWLEARCRAGVNVITSPEVLMRRSVVDVVGGQRSLAHAHDMEMWLRLASVADVGHIGGTDQAWHREHDGSLSAREVGSMLVDLAERREAFDVLFAGPAGRDPSADRMHRAAKLALAREALRRGCHEFDRGRGDPDVARELSSFALELAPAHLLRREVAALERRVILGSRRVQRRPWYQAAALGRRAATEFRLRRWAIWGV